MDDLSLANNIDQVVPDSSAQMWGYSNFSIHANHIDMVRFRDMSDPGYQGVSGYILEWMQNMSRRNGAIKRINTIEPEGI